VLDKRDGSEIWRKERNEITNWATPVVTEVNGREQVLLSGLKACKAYDLETGDEIWSVTGMTSNAIPTPIVGHGLAYFMTGFQRSSMVAVRLNAAKGDVTGTDAVVWTNNRAAPYVPSAMLAGERLYFLRSSDSVISCFNALDGTPHYRVERLELGEVYASIVGGGDKLYVCGRGGSVAVIRDADAFELIAMNKLDEGINATPAIVGNELLIRGNQHLYCFEEGGAQ
jgi:outer membrane protein assembly factor BamB